MSENQQYYKIFASYQSVVSELRMFYATGAEFHSIIQKSLDMIVDKFGFFMAWYAELRENEKLIVPVLWAGKYEKYLDGLQLAYEDNPQDAKCAMSVAILTKEPFGYADLEHDEDFEKWREFALAYGYRSNLAIPLVIDGQCRSAFLIYSNRAFAFSEQLIEYLKGIVNELATIITNLTERKRAEKALRSACDQMEQRVFERTAQLEDTNIRLLREIEDRKRASKENEKLQGQLRQAHKMEAIGTLAGGIAHDFNNILGMIIGNADLAMYEVPEWHAGREYLEEIQKASRRAKKIVRQLLSFSRKAEERFERVDVVQIANESLKLLRSSIPASIEFQKTLTDESCTILGDPTQLHQAIINLVTNASHAMQRDGGILEVAVERVELKNREVFFDFNLPAGTYIRLTVADTGDGIQHEILDRIFDPYFTTKEVGKGTGMGLSVVHGIVKNHNGAITVRSQSGNGTSFSLLFPVIDGEPPQGIKIDQNIPKGNERILFIDDEKTLLNLGSRMLGFLGYQVEIRLNPVEALERFRSNPNGYNLVITDMAMPKMTGDKLIRNLLKINPSVKTILCTGFSENIDEEKALELGAMAFMLKPLDWRDLAITVRKVLDC